MGCSYLLRETWRVRPTLHVFGHVHAGRGFEPIFWDEAQREWEGLCALRQGGRGFLLADLVGIRAWVRVLKVVVYSLKGVLWSRVWGGMVNGGMLVNAACMYRSTGRLGNEPQVVYL